MDATRIVPISVICALGLAIVMNSARGRTNQAFDGLVVLEYPRYEFYPGVKDCRRQGTAYWLVPNREVLENLQTMTDLKHIERLFRGAWRVKLRGDLSRIGRYGFQGSYWRELQASYIRHAEPLDCKDIP